MQIALRAVESALQIAQLRFLRKHGDGLRKTLAQGLLLLCLFLQFRQSGTFFRLLRTRNTRLQRLQTGNLFRRFLFFRAQTHCLLLHEIQLIQIAADAFKLRGQLRNFSGAAVERVFPFFQQIFQLRVGFRAVLTRTDKCAEPFFQLGVAGYRQTELTDKGGTFKHAASYAAKHPSAVFSGQLRHGDSALRFIGAELSHRNAPGCRSFNRNLSAVPDQIDSALHGAPVPWTIAFLDRKSLVGKVCAFGGVHAVKHRHQKRAPGGFSRFIRQGEQIHPLVQLQRIVELSEGSAHSLNNHSAASLPSISAVTSLAAAAIFRFWSSSSACS